MSEIKILKNGNRYIDWTGKPSTQEAYLAQFAKAEELVAKPFKTSSSVLKIDATLERSILYSNIPHKSLLLGADITVSDDLPTTIAGLKKISGIGKKSAADIAQWVDEHWGIVIKA
jgi:hypothetical protein